MSAPRQIKPYDLEEALNKAADEIGENIRKHHFRRLRGRRLEMVEEREIDLKALLAEMDNEDEEEVEE